MIQIVKKIIAESKVSLSVFRAIYGKPTTPLEDREYKLKGHSAVGNVEEMIQHFGKQYSKIIFYSTNGSEIEQQWENLSGKWKKTK